MNSRSLIHQAGVIRSYFPDTEITRDGESALTWVGWLQPTPLSARYKVKVQYSRKKGISVFVLEPRLEIARGSSRLPHVYDQQSQELCLFYPKDREWDISMWIAKTIIPWASEWLYFYELWLVTDGDWLGGGVTHQEAPEKSTKTNIEANNDNGAR